MAAAPWSPDLADRAVSWLNAAELRRSLRQAAEDVAPLGVGRGRARRMAATGTLRRAVRSSRAQEGGSPWTPAWPALGLGAAQIRDLG